MTGLLRIVLLTLLVSMLAAPAALAARTYTVQPGDTLSDIAARFDTTVQAIVEANNIQNPDMIYPGQRLIIPGEGGDDDTVTQPATNPPAATPEPPAAGRTGPDSLLATTRVLSYYGNPWSAQMGILGEHSKDELVARLRRTAANYERVGGMPVKPAIHMVATVAQNSPGADGMWRFRMPPEVIQEYADLAAANDMLFIIDIQIGHSDWATEIEAMRPFLSQPHVHLAMDPEFDMAPGHTPGIHYGSTRAADINHAIRYLEGLSGELGLPQKMLIVHQFRYDMLPDKELIEDSERVDVVICMDGFGGRQIKIDNYHALVRDQPVEFGGFKIFYRQDTPVMTPEDVFSSLGPIPAFITFQ